MELKKKKLNKFNVLITIVNLIILIMAILSSILLLRNNILPLKHLIIYFTILVIIPIITLFFLVFKKTPFKIKIGLIVLDVLYILILVLLSFYLYKTYNFLDKVTDNSNYITRNYQILVPVNSEYQKIKDLDNKNIGYVNMPSIDYPKALNELKKVITFQVKDYLDYTVMFEAIRLEELDAFILSDTYYDILTEEMENVKNEYRVIYEFSIKEEIKNITKDVDVTSDCFNIFISGLDTFQNITTNARSDVNILISINPKTSQILMIHIPRDYYVVFHGQDVKDKLTHAGLYGTEMSIKTVEDLLDIDINYYLKVNFNAVTKLVDALGGVDVYSQYAFQAREGGIYFAKGYNHVNGEQALTFSRIRKVLPGGDRARGQNQQAVIQAIIKKATSTSTILTRYTSILESLEGEFITNLSSDKIKDIIRMQLDRSPKWNITSISLDGTDSENYTSAFPDKKVYVMEPDEQTIITAKETLQAIKNGKILESSYKDNTSGDVFIPYIPKPTPKPKDEEETTDDDTTEDINPDTEIQDDENSETNDPETNPDSEEVNPTPSGGDENTNPEDTETNPSPTPDSEEDDILDIPGLVN